MGTNPAFALMIEENHEKTSVRLVGTGIWTRDLPNASLVCYHGATSLGTWGFVVRMTVFLFFYFSSLAARKFAGSNPGHGKTTKIMNK